MRNIFFIFLLLSIGASAQVGTNKSSTIIQSGNSHWRLNGHKLKWKELKNELNTVPLAMPDVKKASTKLTIGLVCFFATLGLAISSQTYDKYGNIDNHIGLKIAAIASFSTSAAFLFGWKKSVKKAVVIYNSR